jgi:hypothetical protein
MSKEQCLPPQAGGATDRECCRPPRRAVLMGKAHTYLAKFLLYPVAGAT